MSSITHQEVRVFNCCLLNLNETFFFVCENLVVLAYATLECAPLFIFDHLVVV